MTRIRPGEAKCIANCYMRDLGWDDYSVYRTAAVHVGRVVHVAGCCNGVPTKIKLLIDGQTKQVVDEAAVR